MPLPLTNPTLLPSALPRVVSGSVQRGDDAAIGTAVGAGAKLGLARNQVVAKQEPAALRDDASKPQRLPNQDNTPLQPSLNAVALELAQDRKLSREQSLALGSYLQTQSLSAEQVDSGRELLVGVDTFA